MENRTSHAERSGLRELRAQLESLGQIYLRLDIASKIALWFIVIIHVVAFAAPLIAPYEPAQEHYEASLQGPSLEHPLGTDLTGRDVLSRIIYGARISLLVGIVAVGTAVFFGTLLGSIAGYVGGWIDETIMRTMDIIISVPVLVLALALVGAVGPSLTNIILIIGFVYTPQYARLMRGSVLSTKENEYVEAARGTGLSSAAVLGKHVVPNSITPVVVQATYHVATAIILESSLSFLGIGIQPPTPSWGGMIADGRQYLPSEWWITTFAGLMIMITVLAFNIIGDGLRDVIDPETETRGGGAA